MRARVNSVYVDYNNKQRYSPRFVRVLGARGNHTIVYR